MPVNDILTPITRSRTLSRVAVYAVLVGVYSLVPVWKDFSIYSNFADLPAEFHAALTLVLGLLLVFRTNTAYARWWEARTLWGALVNASRNLTCKIYNLTEISDDLTEEIKRRTIAFPYALKDHLRDEPANINTPGFEPHELDAKHIPSQLVGGIYQRLRTAKQAGQIDGDEMRAIDEELKRLLDICGGCERIRKTRIVRSYRVFARQCVFLFLATFPWGISNDFGWWTVIVSVFTAYFMLGLETVAEHVEEPFGYDEDDLDLEGLCRTIHDSIDQIAASEDPHGVTVPT